MQPGDLEEQHGRLANVAGLTAEWVTAWWCPECEQVCEETAGEPLYECVECAESYNRSGSADGNSHRCPSCNRFGARICDDSCYDCGTMEPEEATMLRCDDCGAYLEDAEEFAQHNCRQAAQGCGMEQEP